MSAIFILAAGMFALGLDAYVVAGLLPGITSAFGIDAAEAGQAVSVFTFCYAAAAPMFATLLAGKPVRRVLVTALAIFAAANAASALSSSFAMLLAARAVAGLGAGLFSPVAVAAAAALVPPERKGRALGLTLGGMSTGTVVGVPIGLWISAQAGWRATLWLVTGVGLIALLGVLRKLPNLPVAPPPSLAERLAMLTHRRVAAIAGISFLTAVASLGLYTYVSPMLAALTGTTHITPFLWFWGLGGLVGSFCIGPLIDGTRRPACLLAIILALLTLALASIPTLAAWGALAFVPFLIWGAAGWSSLAPQQHMLLELQPQHGAVAVAVNSSCNYLGSAAGTVLGGVLITLGANPAALPYDAAAVSGVALLAHLFKQMAMRRRRTAS
ncbi:MFS transporter [Burkholderia perseverans]|uniref:MFS transporter n=1 Tax=Burkholderia perseverans TaxID=2615214 RepID=UPI001FED58A8|nr:MFS transporter [Burkholderia perseverans]